MISKEGWDIMDFGKLKSLMDRFVEENYAPGNTVKVYLGGKEVFSYSCGYSDPESGTLMTGEEHFFFYSCSKIATVTAALQLVEKGIILLDDPLYEYLPEYKDMYIKRANGEMVPATREIKVLNLFNMTAGFDYDMSSDGIKRARELTHGRMDTEAVARCMASDPLSFEPGERFQYSRCHDVLGGLVSAVTGKPFRDYVRENIFEPLGMTSSAYHLTPEIEKNMATQYRFVQKDSEELDLVESQKYGNGKDGFYVKEGNKNYHILGSEYDSGGAGIITTVSDYAKFAAALANWGTGLTGERILSPATVELMRTNTLDAEQIKTFNWPQLKGYGYGLGVRTLTDRIRASSLSNIGEFGWGGAAGASVYIDPEINLAAVYAKHTLNPREGYYQPRVRNAIYAGI